MMTFLKTLAAKFDALKSRERLLITLTVVIMLYAIMDFAGLSQNPAKQKQKQTQLLKLRASNTELLTKIAALPKAAEGNPDEALRQKIEALRAAMDDAEQHLEKESVNLISPEEMSRVIEEFVAKQGELHLVGLRSLPAEALSALADDTQKLARLYKHGMVVEVEGSYDAIRRYIKALEDSSWRLYWDSIELTTDGYPRVTAKLGVYTLSLSTQWLSL